MLRPSSIVVVLAAAAWIASGGSTLAAASSVVPVVAGRGDWSGWDRLPVSPAEERLFADAAGHRAIRGSLLENALIVGGIDEPARRAGYLRRFQAWCDEFRIAVAPRSPLQLATALHQFMHRRILIGGYDERATDLSAIFDSGRFNCVSSCVLFNCLAAEFGLQARAVEFPAHVRSLTADGPRRFELETTCPSCRPIERLAGKDAPRSRNVDDTQLLAIVYYNRGVDLLNRQQYAAAVSANLRALRLDRDNPTASANLLAAVNNWSLALCEQGQYSAAIELLSRARREAPGNELFRVNQLHAIRTWADALSRTEGFAAARAMLARVRLSLPDEPQLARIDDELRRRTAP